MENLLQIQQLLQRSRRLPALVIGVALTVLGATIAISMLGLRVRLQREMANHDGEVLYAVALMEQNSVNEDPDATGSLTNPAAQFDLALAISRLRGVLGIRLFTAEGRFVNALPAYISESVLPSEDLARLRRLHPLTRYYPKGRWADFDLLSGSPSPAVPLLVVDVPMHSGDPARLVGVAQFIIQGESLSQTLAALDRNLATEAAIFFLVGGGFLTVSLWLGFRRLERANRLLAERTAGLLRANQELTLAAKTSAVGAVAAHLIHGLRNPLSGLQSFVDHQSSGAGRPDDAEWKEAVSTARRMQGLVGEVVRILSETQVEVGYEIALEELLEILSARIRPRAQAAGVHLTTHHVGQGTLSNQQVNLALLILENLVQNALEVVSPGKSVHLKIECDRGRFLCEVADEGPGLSDTLRLHLFTPCRSTKEGGAGIGLAISKQLAAHLGGTLELHSSSPRGCVFRLTIPVEPHREGHPAQLERTEAK